MRTIRRDGWTAADYDSEQILRHELGHRDAAARLNRARRPHPVRRAWRTLRTRLHRLAPNTPRIDWAAARAAAAAVHRGDGDEADRIVMATVDPHSTAFATFRLLNTK
ncbi:hypothetical protein AB0L33_30285 [Streptomyces sp. NPDC052299]|uniref:hypothetical protein n=1 Tax=Streptomyces sp. NPDC052299 TaxID=3155054 RepID=UPI003441669D